MKRHLTIAIDANRVTCGKCEHVSSFDKNGPVQCGLFEQELYAKGGIGDWVRCAPCLAAEREAT